MIRFRRYTSLWIIAFACSLFAESSTGTTQRSANPAMRSGGWAVDVHVADSGGSPIDDAYVWLGPQMTVYDISDSGGDATLTSNFSTNFMVVVRHRLYGRVSPLYFDLTEDTNFTVVLPALTHIRIASYNMEGNRDNGKWNDEQILPLARVFWTVQPDVVLLQECPGSGFQFSEFAEQYLPGYESAESTEGYYIHNGICSFYPIYESFSEGGTLFTRDLFGARISIPPEDECTFLSAHYKAGSTTNDREQRNEEAEFTGEYCSNLHASATSYVFGGDLNDDPVYPRPPAVVFDILSSSGAELVRLDPRDDGGSTVTIPVISRRYDYLMPLSTIADDLVQSAVFRTETMQSLPPWLDETDSELASDHRMVYADIAVLPEPCVLMGILVLLVVYIRRI